MKLSDNHIKFQSEISLPADRVDEQNTLLDISYLTIMGQLYLITCKEVLSY